MQLAQAIEIFEFVQRHDISPEDVLDLNQSVEERIRYCLRKDWVREERIDQLVDTGIAYVKLCNANSHLKVRYYTDRSTEVRIAPELFDIAYQVIVEQCEIGFLRE